MRHQKSFWPRGKCLGGSSVLNFMAYVRGDRKDFNQWENEEGASGWGWEGVKPFFIKSESLIDGPDYIDKASHGFDGPLTVSLPTDTILSRSFIEGAKQAGFVLGDYNNGDMCNKVSLFQQTIRNGSRCDTAKAFLRAASKRSNLTVVTKAQVARILMDGTQAKGVVAFDVDSKLAYNLWAKKEVVLSAGTIGSPHILMLSGIGPQAQLEKAGIECILDCPYVGQNMEDHIAVPLRFDAAATDIQAVNDKKAEGFPGGILQLFRWVFQGQGLLATPCYDATLFYKTKGFESSHPSWGPDMQIGMFATPANELIVSTNIGYEPNYLDGRLGPDEEGFLMVPCLLHLHTLGMIEVQSSDPFQAPKIVTNYFKDQRDIVAAADSMNKCLEIAKNMPGVAGEPILPADMLERHHGQTSDAFWEDFVRHYGMTLYHPTSTCSIGKVVSPTLLVHGIQNLVVADASVMPHVISGNTNAPSIMIGEKAAHMIAQRHGLTLADSNKEYQPSSKANLFLGAAAIALASYSISKL